MVKSLLDLIGPEHPHNLTMMQANGTVYHIMLSHFMRLPVCLPLCLKLTFCYYHFPSIGHHELKMDSFLAGILCSLSGLPGTLTVGEALHQSSALVNFTYELFIMLLIGDIAKPLRNHALTPGRANRVEVNQDPMGYSK